MKSLTDLKLALLEWRREGDPPLAFKLRGEGGIVATLVFPDPPDTLAKVETAEGSWTLKHLGVLNPVTTLREEGRAANLAVFHSHAFRHGKLEFADRAVFDWADLHGDEPGGAFLDLEGRPMVRLHQAHRRASNPGGPSDSCLVELGQAPQARWRHGILAALGWYLLLLNQPREHPEHAAEASLML